jgi:hypothetical protein
MKLIQKLEIGAGMVICLVIFVCFFILTDMNSGRYPRFPHNNEEINMLLIFGLCSLITSVGSYFEIFSRSSIALVALCIGGIILIVILGLFGFFFFISGGYGFGLLLLSPIPLTVIRILLAITGRMQKSEKTLK